MNDRVCFDLPSSKCIVTPYARAHAHTCTCIRKDVTREREAATTARRPARPRWEAAARRQDTCPALPLALIARPTRFESRPKTSRHHRRRCCLASFSLLVPSFRSKEALRGRWKRCARHAVVLRWSSPPRSHAGAGSNQQVLHFFLSLSLSLLCINHLPLIIIISVLALSRWYRHPARDTADTWRPQYVFRKDRSIWR